MHSEPTMSNKALAIRRSWDFGSMSFQMAAQHATTKPKRKTNITHEAAILIVYLIYHLSQVKYAYINIILALLSGSLCGEVYHRGGRSSCWDYQ
jgi:hypothetical protein